MDTLLPTWSPTGKLRRDNDVDHLLARVPGVQVPDPVRAFYFDNLDLHLPGEPAEPGPALVERHGRDRTLGVGVLDVRTPEVEPGALIERRIGRALRVVPPDRIIVTPDCGLRHLPAPAARAKLHAMTTAAATVRARIQEGHPR